MDIDSVWGRNSHKYLNHTMLRGALRPFIIKKVKDPLRKFLIFIAGRLPPPTKINTLNPNSHILLDKMDKFLSLENNPHTNEMFRAAFKILICEYEHDPYYRARFDWMLEELVEEVMDGKWAPRQNDAPRSCWGEIRPYGQNLDRRYAEKIAPFS